MTETWDWVYVLMARSEGYFMAHFRLVRDVANYIISPDRNDPVPHKGHITWHTWQSWFWKRADTVHARACYARITMVTIGFHDIFSFLEGFFEMQCAIAHILTRLHFWFYLEKVNSHSIPCHLIWNELSCDATVCHGCCVSITLLQ